MLFMLVRVQVLFVLYLSLYNFYLSRTIGQSLMYSPGVWVNYFDFTTFYSLADDTVSAQLVCHYFTILKIFFARKG